MPSVMVQRATSTVFTDDFDRANGAVANGWVIAERSPPTEGVWTITSNKVGLTVLSTSGEGSLLVRSGVPADFDMQFTVSAITAATTRYLAAWRVKDIGGAGALMSHFTLQIFSSGALRMLRNNPSAGFTTVGTVPQAIASGDIIRITGVGDTHKVYVNGVLKLTVVDTMNQTTGLAHGLMSDSTAVSFDNFSLA